MQIGYFTERPSLAEPKAERANESARRAQQLDSASCR